MEPNGCGANAIKTRGSSCRRFKSGKVEVQIMSETYREHIAVRPPRMTPASQKKSSACIGVIRRLAGVQKEVAADDQTIQRQPRTRPTMADQRIPAQMERQTMLPKSGKASMVNADGVDIGGG